MESNALRYFWLLFQSGQGCLLVFNIKKFCFLANVKALSHQKWNKYALGWRESNSRLYNRTQKKKVQHTSAIKKEAQIFI